MLNSRYSFTKSPGVDNNDSTFIREPRAINNRTIVDKDFNGQKLEINKLPKKFEKEILHLKNINDRLSKELKKCQYIMGIEAPSLEDVYLGENEKTEEFEEILNIMNSSYYMSPLLLAYDDHFYNVEKELKNAHLEISRLHENMRLLELENAKLSDNLELKIREYSKLVAKTIENSDILTNFHDEKVELNERWNLLTEENQMLLEQVTLLKSHYDTYNKDYWEKVEDVEKKINSYDALYTQYQQACKDLIDYQKNNQFLETKVREKERTLGIIEEKRKNEVKELNKLKTEHNLMQQEVAYYKDQVDRLNYRIAQDKEAIDKQVRQTKDKEGNCQDIVARLEAELERAKTECRKINKQLKDKTSEQNESLKLNSELQMLIQELKEKERNTNELGQSYKDKLEKLKLDQEKMKMKEENYIRQIQKLESDHKIEVARKEDKYESLQSANNSRASKKYEELDEKYSQALSEIDHLKSMFNSKESLLKQIESEVNSANKKEDKVRKQYESQLNEVKISYKNLESEMSRLESDKEKYEVSLDKLTRDARNNEKRLETQIDDLKRDLESAKDDIDMLRAEKKKLMDKLNGGY